MIKLINKIKTNLLISNNYSIEKDISFIYYLVYKIKDMHYQPLYDLHHIV